MHQTITVNLLLAIRCQPYRIPNNLSKNAHYCTNQHLNDLSPILAVKHQYSLPTIHRPIVANHGQRTDDYHQNKPKHVLEIDAIEDMATIAKVHLKLLQELEN